MHPWRGLRGLPRSVWLLSASTLVNRLGLMALPFLLLYLVQGRGWSPAEASTAMLLYGAGGMVSAPLSGRLADRLGHVKVLQGSLWLTGLVLLVIPFATTRFLLYPLIFLWSAFSQAFWPSAMALITCLVPPDQRRSAFALHRAAVNLGMSVGPAAGGFIAHQSYTWVFWTDGLTTLAAVIILALWLGPVHQEPHAPEAHAASRSPWRDSRFVLFILSLLPAFAVFFQVEGALPLWVVKDLGHGTRFFGLLFTVNTILIVALEVGLNTVMARWPHGKALALGSLCYAVGFGLTAFATTKSALMGTVVVWTFGEMILLPGSSDAVASLSPPERRGEYMGLYALTFAAALTLGPWLGVRGYAWAGPRWVWAGCAACALFSALRLWSFRVPEASSAMIVE